MGTVPLGLFDWIVTVNVKPCEASTDPPEGNPLTVVVVDALFTGCTSEAAGDDVSSGPLA